MKTKWMIPIVVLGLFYVSCGPASFKFSGIYSVSDSWTSSKTDIGTGNLEYDLTIVPDGNDGVILMNVNKTLNRVKAKVKGDELIVEKQVAVSSSGKAYAVLGQTGKLSDNKLVLKFSYSDTEYANGIGEITCEITGTKASFK